VEAMMRGARYRNAGYTVAAYHHGMKITRVNTILEECATKYRRPGYGSWSEARREAVIILTGQLADQRASWGETRLESFEEFLANAQKELEVVELGDGLIICDHLALLEPLKEMARDPLSGGLKECYDIVVKDARKLVYDYWTAIEGVAIHLEEYGEDLDGEYAVWIIEATYHQPDEPPPNR
jgi:hypothetical protein